MACFAEQSRTTFRHATGRPSPFVLLLQAFPLPRTWHLAFRTGQETLGLALAGDYTRQRFVGTMEGAAISGRKAAAAVQSDLTASGGG